MEQEFLTVYESRMSTARASSETLGHDPMGGTAEQRRAGNQFTCFTGTQVQLLTQLEEQTKQDVQAKLLQSKTGRIKDKHVSKLASDILANLPQPSPQDLCATPELLVACEELRQRQPTAFQNLANVLTRAQETSPHHLAVCDVAGAILEALSGPDEEQRLAQWAAFVAAFCPSPEEEIAFAAEGGSVVVGQSRRSKLDCLISPLVELIGTEEFWPIHASGESRRAGDVTSTQVLAQRRKKERILTQLCCRWLSVAF